MFTRIAELRYKPERKGEFFHTLNHKIVPALRRVHGLQDITALESASEPNAFVSVLTFRRREDAEVYATTLAKVFLSDLEPYLDSAPNIRTFEVYYSSIHDVAPEVSWEAAKAA